MAIKVNWEIVSSKIKKEKIIEDKIKSSIWKAVWWIDKKLDLYDWIILADKWDKFLIKAKNRSIFINPSWDTEDLLIDKSMIYYDKT